ncbi:MAG: hypothetical protein LBG83_06770 [Oscillospiraceae bacterium]|jgi:hypothetical protein|nr:hypothetical protein [Oscillospiraceae bacterium]
MLLQSLAEYPWAWGLLAAGIALCVFAWAKAMQAARRRAAKKAALVARLDHEKALREEFAEITQQLLIDMPPERLIEGLCCHLQMRLEKEPDMRAAFGRLPEFARWIYALGYVIQDSRDMEHDGVLLSEFFRKNGEPLLTAAMEAVQMLVGGEYAEVFNAEFAMFDNENEAVSLLDDQLLLLDARFYGILREAEPGTNSPYLEVKEAILANSDIFVTN